MIGWDDVVRIVEARRAQDAPLLQQMLEVQRRYNGDIAIPLPEMDTNPVMPALTPALMAGTIDAYAIRAASVRPRVECPPIEPMKDRGTKSMEYARIRQKTIYATWHKNKLPLGLRRMYRHISGYATAVLVVVPDYMGGYPAIEVRNPLGCVDPETEILTRRGWLHYTDLRVGDEVAGYDMETGLARWTTCQHISVYDCDEEITAVDRRGLSMRLTKDHRTIVHKIIQRGINRPGKPFVIKAPELNSTHFIPKAAEWEDFGDKSIGSDLAALIGWVAAEGNYGHARSRAVYLCQSQSANPTHVASIDAILHRLSVYGDDGWRKERMQGTGYMVEWKLSRALSDEMRRLMPAKMLGQWALDLPPFERQALLDAFIDGDGSREPKGKVSIAQATKPNMDVLQAVAITLGYKTTLGEYDDSGTPGSSVKYILYLSKSRVPQSLRNRAKGTLPGKMPTEHYTGKVWCPMTGTGTWFARRKGTVFITGNSYPEPRAAEDMAPVQNCGFVYERSAEHLRKKYPEAMRENGGVIGLPGTDPELWDVIEWLDADQTIIGILGPRDMGSQSYQDSRKLGVAPSQMLRQWMNLTGRCPVVTMPRITLDRVASQVAHQLGNIDLQAKMLALAIVAEERAIFPDRYVVGKDGMAPRIVSNGGAWQDGRTGSTNLLEGVAQVGQLVSAPPPSTGQTMDRLERNYHVSVGDNPTFGGETYGSLRTGKGIDSMIGSQVDPRVQEMQQIVEYGLSYANELVLDTWKSCFGHKKQTLFSGWGGVTDTFELDPLRHIENCNNVVAYSVAGADVQSTTIILGQLLGTKTISQRTFRDRHPYVEDAEAEERQLDVEDLKAAAFAAIQQQVASGQMPKMAITWLYDEMKQGKNIFEAQSAVDAKMSAMQAQQAPAPEAPQPGEPAMAGAPGAMPGLEGPAQQQAPLSPDAAIGPAQGSVGVRQLVKALGERPTPQ